MDNDIHDFNFEYYERDLIVVASLLGLWVIPALLIVGGIRWCFDGPFPPLVMLPVFLFLFGTPFFIWNFWKKRNKRKGQATVTPLSIHLVLENFEQLIPFDQIQAFLIYPQKEGGQSSLLIRDVKGKTVRIFSTARSFSKMCAEFSEQWSGYLRSIQPPPILKPEIEQKWISKVQIVLIVAGVGVIGMHFIGPNPFSWGKVAQPLGGIFTFMGILSACARRLYVIEKS